MVKLAFLPDLHFTYVEAHRLNIAGANGAHYSVQVPIDLPKRSIWIMGEHEFTAVVWGKVRCYHGAQKCFEIQYGDIGTSSYRIANQPIICGTAAGLPNTFYMDYWVGGGYGFVKRFQFVSTCDMITLELDSTVTNCGNNPWFYDIVLAVMSEKIW